MHSDLNACYASIEELHRPELRGRPLAVGGDVEQRHGIILAKNQLAKAQGVKTGQAIWEAKQQCLSLTVVPPNYDLYWRFCKRARNIYGEYTDRVEPFGIDEAWLDLTGCIRVSSGGEAVAQELRRRIKEELGLTVSIGVSYNKIFAKLGSDYKKPDAVTVITPKNYRELVWPLPAADLLYVGRATDWKLERYGVRTIGDLAQASDVLLKTELGKMGLVLGSFARGEDRSSVARLGDEALVRSVGNGVTAPRDIHTSEEAKVVFWVLAESVGERLRELGFLATTLQISVRDSGLCRYERQHKLVRPTSLASDLCKSAMELLMEHHNWRGNPIRSLELRGCELMDAQSATPQMSLFEDEERRCRREALEETVDALRRRYGRDTLRRGVTMTELGNFDPRGHTIHPVSFFR